MRNRARKSIRMLAGCGVAILLITGCGERETARQDEAGPTVAVSEIRGEPLSPPAPPPVAEPPPVVPEEAIAESAPAEIPAPEPITTSSASASPVATGTIDQPMAVAFEKLAGFQYAVPDGAVDTNTVEQAQMASQIPDPIKALHNQYVSLKGFMLPLKVEKGLVTELLIMRDQSMCCYGTVPRINEWVSVKMLGPGVKPIMDQAVTLYGKLKVGEMYENGYLVGIYAMDGDRMAGPLDM